MVHHRERLARWVELGLFSLTPLGKRVHQQMIPQHDLLEDRQELSEAMQRRREAGRRYRGY